MTRHWLLITTLLVVVAGVIGLAVEHSRIARAAWALLLVWQVLS